MSQATDGSRRVHPDDPAMRAVLIRMLRVAFPHPRVADGPYERTADRVCAAALASPWLRVTLAEGLRALDEAAGGDFRGLDDARATALLRAVERTAFFALVRGTAVRHLYDDAELWDVVGYEGPSFARGGYLHRGFDDLDWLPEPRVAEYDGAPLDPLPSREDVGR